MSDQITLLLSTNGETFFFHFVDNENGRNAVCKRALELACDPRINFDENDAEMVFDQMDQLDYYPYSYEAEERMNENEPRIEKVYVQDGTKMLFCTIVGGMLGFLLGMWVMV